MILLTDIAYAQMCEVSHIRTSLRKALFDYLQNPVTASLSLPKIKDLLNFYLSIPRGEVTIDCSNKGWSSNVAYVDIVNEADNIAVTIPVCPDGTKYGECSLARPRYCYAGSLVKRCNICGCPSIRMCQKLQGNCVETPENITCNVNSDCGIDDYIGDYFCEKKSVYTHYVYRYYTSYNCTNPGTVNSACSSYNKSVLIGPCKYPRDPNIAPNIPVAVFLEDCTAPCCTCCHAEEDLSRNCSDGTPRACCSRNKPFYCAFDAVNNRSLLQERCMFCPCPSGYDCGLDGYACIPIIKECTPANDIIKNTDYPTGSCQSPNGYEWSHSNCSNTQVCKKEPTQESCKCKLVNATMTSYTLPSGKYARSDTISVPYRIKNVGDINWCFLTEAETTKADGSNTEPKQYTSVKGGGFVMAGSLNYAISCSDPLGNWSGSLNTYTDQEEYGGWKVGDSPTFSFKVVECLDNGDCINCLGSLYSCNSTTNSCFTVNYCQILLDRFKKSYVFDGDSCGKPKYDKVVDIDKNRIIDYNDLYNISSNFENQTWCLDRLNDPTDPCI